MKRDLLTQLADYGDYCEQRQGSVAIDDIDPIQMLDPWASSAGSVDTAVDSAESETCEACGADLTVFDLRRPDERTSSPPRKRRAAVLAVAAAIMLVAGIVVVDGNGDDVVTDPVTSATTPEPVPSPTPPDPTPLPQEVGPPPSFVDSLGYRWSRVPYDEAFFGSDLYRVGSVTAGGAGFVAVGSFQQRGDWVTAVWTSVDGLTWSRVPRDEALFGGDGRSSTSDVSDVAVGGPGLVAVGRGDGPDGAGVAAVWTSVDGLAWSRVPHDEAVFGGGMIRDVVVGGPGLVAVGYVGHGGPDDPPPAVAAVWTSVDGLVWSRVPHDEAVFGGESSYVMLSVTAGGPGFVAVGEEIGTLDIDVAVWTSVDGLTWSRVPHDEAVFGGPGNQSAIEVIEGGPGLVAVGGDFEIGGWEEGGGSAAVWTSVDGLTWSRVPHDEAVFGAALEPRFGKGAMLDVTATGSGLVAVGLAGVWTSADGLTWSHQPVGEFVFNVADGGSPGLPAVVALGDGAVWVATPEN